MEDKATPQLTSISIFKRLQNECPFGWNIIATALHESNYFIIVVSVQYSNCIIHLMYNCIYKLESDVN